MSNIALVYRRILPTLIVACAPLEGCLADAAEGGDELSAVSESEQALSNGGFQLKNTNTGKCLSADGALHSLAYLRDCNAQTTTQRWGFDGGLFKHLASGLCLDIFNASQANGAVAQLFTCQGNANQDFRFYPTQTLAGVTVTNWYFVVRHSSKCLQPGATNDPVIQSSACQSVWNVQF